MSRSLFLIPMLILAGSLSASEMKPAKLEFNRDIRPLLSENCYRCHGPDKGNRKAKLRLDQRESAIAKAITPGKPDESELVKRIYSTDPEELMPSPESHKQLTNVQKELLKRWIAEGAEYQPHWAYIVPQRPVLPVVNKQEWPQNPIDSFVLHNLEEKKIQPSGEADRRTLLRRLSLDLIGLPPTPGEVESFVANKDPKAYEHAVDRLMASPHFGERMAVPWLDVVRFSDTVGYHGDQNLNIFPYRDYVINAFNANKRFDQFTIEQLAGDLLPNPTAEQRVASGYNRLNMVTREGGAQPKEYLAKYGADRVRALAGAWLGSTMGCCECHDHKFDPFTTRDFYRMKAFFADVKQWGVYADYGYTPNPDLKGWDNDHPFPPEIEVESPYLKQRVEKLRGRLAEHIAPALAKLDVAGAEQTAYSKWRASIAEFLRGTPGGWSTPKPDVLVTRKMEKPKAAPAKAEPKPAADKKSEPGTKSETLKDAQEKPKNGNKEATEPAPAPPEYAIQSDGSVLFDKAGASVELKLAELPPWIAAVKVELIPDAKHAGTILLEGKKSIALKDLKMVLRKKEGDKTQTFTFRHADDSLKDPIYRNGFSLLGIQKDWKIAEAQIKVPHTSFWLLDQPVQTAPGDTLTLKFPENTLGRVRISVSPLAAEADVMPALDAATLKALQTAPETPETRSLTREMYLRSTGWDSVAFGDLKKVEGDILECRNGKSMTLVSESIKPLETRVLARGNWQDESGEVVEPGVPLFLTQVPNPDKRRLTRLDLANWLISPDNPLTSRAVMNRMWKQFFGTGISTVVDDLGGQGEWPVNPELLDWLAVEFRESGWDVKHMVKLMVMSSTYRQDSNLRPELRDIDPNNRFLASQSPRRLEAEFVRDNALSIAGLLNLDIGGPSDHPYQPRGYYAALQFPDRDYYPDKDERQYRRGVYMHWQRTFLHPMLANFDAPSRDECTCSRNVANTPQQALTLLNDPTFVEASRVFAQRLLNESNKSDGERIETAFQLALSRTPKAKEKESLIGFLGQQREHYKSGGDDSKKLLSIGMAPVSEKLDSVELAAWTETCRVILNLHETITRY